MNRTSSGSDSLLVLAWLVVLVLTRAADGADAPPQRTGGDDYTAVKALLRQRCFACHGALKQSASLRLDTAEAMLEGGRSGPVVVSGKPEQSLLLKRVRAVDEDDRMPPEGQPLELAEIALIERWIVAGAPAPAGEQPEEDPRRHWAFVPPVRPPVPQVDDATRIAGPIDAFLAVRREEHGIVPAQQATKRELLRRVTLDLTGLPPTPQEMAGFLADASPGAYRRVVDRLLASPRHGERWGRHWMDVWRYSDWYGRRNVPDVLNSYGQIWRWRDWIVRSINEGRPYDRMVAEMLAGDELAPGDPETVVATGFIVRNFYRWNYNTWMKDNVEHTGKAFLGLTLNCAQCHDHKYDPITQEDYFKFRAVFEPIEIRHDRLPGEPDPGPYPKYKYGTPYKPITSGLVRVFDEKLDAETFLYTGGEARNVIPGKPPIPPGVPSALGGDAYAVRAVPLPVAVSYPGSQRFVQEEERAGQEKLVALARKELDSLRTELAAATGGAGGTAAPGSVLALRLGVAERNLASAEAAHEALLARIRSDRARYGTAPDADAERLARQAALTERRAGLARAESIVARAELALAEARAKKDATARELETAREKLEASRTSREEARSALEAPGDESAPLGPRYPEESTGRRSALARWVTARRNPLAARVAVNHIWLRHFGEALVASTENFGRNGGRPTHPQLLDWLAVEFMESGWDRKHIHRLIVLSDAYRLSSRARPSEATRAADPENRLYWRYKARRVEAEVVRDSILHAAGELDLEMGGREIEHEKGLTHRRRSLYFSHHGEAKMEFLGLFDGANPDACYRRTTSVRPQQALALANSELALAQGRVLARKLWAAADAGDDAVRAFVGAAFERCLSRPASDAELAASLRFLARQTALLEEVVVERGTDALTAPEEPSAFPASSSPAARAREAFVQALFSHSDFVTVR